MTVCQWADQKDPLFLLVHACAIPDSCMNPKLRDTLFNDRGWGQCLLCDAYAFWNTTLKRYLVFEMLLPPYPGQH